MDRSSRVNDEKADRMNRPSCEVLRHPLRVRILELVNETPMSPVRFLNDGLSGSLDRHTTKQNTLSYVSYHFRELEKAGCIEIAELNPRPGATEHVYRGCNRVFFSGEEFAALPLADRMALSRTSFQGLLARTEGAIASRTFDKRLDRHLTWRAVHLDQRGWEELMTVLTEACERAEQIGEDAADRIAGSGEEVIPVTFAMLGFESPPPPMLY